MVNILQKLIYEILETQVDWDLITNNWGKWGKNDLSGITLQSYIRFSQTIPHIV